LSAPPFSDTYMLPFNTNGQSEGRYHLPCEIALPSNQACVTGFVKKTERNPEATSKHKARNKPHDLFGASLYIAMATERCIGATAGGNFLGNKAMATARCMVALAGASFPCNERTK